MYNISALTYQITLQNSVLYRRFSVFNVELRGVVIVTNFAKTFERNITTGLSNKGYALSNSERRATIIEKSQITFFVFFS